MSSVDATQALVLTRWAQKWLRFGWDILLNGTPVEQLAKSLMVHLDKLEEDPGQFVEEIVDERTRTVVRQSQLSHSVVSKTVVGGDERNTTTLEEAVLKDSEDVVRLVVSRKVTYRLMRKQRSNFAAAVSKQAYNKFGERPMSPANIMVTRKWLQKYLEDNFKDLRTCDKNLAIDRALFLSFVPTKDFLKMKILMETKESEKRIQGTNLFGRVFRFKTEGDGL